MNDYGHEQQQNEPAYCHYEEMRRAQTITLQDLADHLTGPALSVVAHVILLALLGTIIVFKPAEDQSKVIDSKIMKIKQVKITPPPKLPDPPPEMTETPKPDRNRPEEQLEKLDKKVDQIQLEQVSVNTSVMPDVTLPPIRMTKASLVLPIPIGGRVNPGQSIKNGGGDPGPILRSVDTSLKWLAENQNPDGSWGIEKSQQPALTGLALLTFLANNQLPSHPVNGMVVKKAIQKCIYYSETIGKNGVIANGGRGYGHAIVAYALAESYAMVKYPPAGEAMDRMMSTIVKGQNSLGSYNYDFNNRAVAPQKKGNGMNLQADKVGQPRCDLSVAGWNYQAIKAAFAAGCEVPGLETAVDKAAQGIMKVHWNQGGGFSYGFAGKGQGKHSMTAVGTLCLQLFGMRESSECKAGLKALQKFKSANKAGTEMKCDWKVPEAWSLYTWYYKTQALFQAYSEKKKTPWRKWNREFAKNICREQHRDGYWTSPMEKYGSREHKKGHGEAVGSVFKNELDLHIYSTTMCAMTLQVYYRYLPSFKLVHSGVTDSLDDADLDDMLEIREN